MLHLGAFLLPKLSSSNWSNTIAGLDKIDDVLRSVCDNGRTASCNTAVVEIYRPKSATARKSKSTTVYNQSVGSYLSKDSDSSLLSISTTCSTISHFTGNDRSCQTS
jgi:hypothetical protein